MTEHDDNTQPFASEVADGWLCGPWRRPTNNSSHERGTIHDDATARALGFRSGTIAGSIHMEQFVPLLDEAFEIDWQRRGSLSLWFREPSIDGEPVRAMVQNNTAPRRIVRMQTADGTEILSGSASAGIDEQGAVRQRLASMSPGVEPRILAPVLGGFVARGLTTRVTQAEVEKRLPILTESRSEFTKCDTYERCIAPMSAAVHSMRVFEDTLPIKRSEFVGLFGAIEWQWINGPMYTEHSYEVSGRVLGVTDSPRSEMLWTETLLCELETGREVARMLMLSRLLKATSRLWNTEPPGK
jgi:hypothetical protein